MMKVSLGDMLWRVTFNPSTEIPEITLWRVIGKQTGSFGNEEYIIRSLDYRRDSAVSENDIGTYAFRTYDEAAIELQRLIN